MKKIEIYVKERPKNCYACPLCHLDEMTNTCKLGGISDENGQPLQCPLLLINDIRTQQKLSDAQNLIEFLGKQIRRKGEQKL